MRRQKWIPMGLGAALVLGTTALGGPLSARADRQPEDRRQAVEQYVGDLLSAWPGAAPVDAQEYRAEVVDRETHTLQIGATGSLELKTVSGDIRTVAGSGLAATVEVVRRSRGRTDADARLGLSEVRAQVDHKGERATVAAVYPQNRSRPPYSVDVSYVVTAPAGTRLTASSVSGNVEVHDIRGDVTSGSVSGNVTVSGATQLSAAKSVSGNVTLRNVSSASGVSAGSVSGHVRLEQVTAPQVNAESVSGSLTLTAATTERASLKSVSGDVMFEGRLARGGRYEFQTHSGNVRVTTAGSAGFELQASTFSGSIRTDLGTAMRAATSTNRSVRGTVGDGSAVLVTTTFSGNVMVTTR